MTSARGYCNGPTPRDRGSIANGLQPTENFDDLLPEGLPGLGVIVVKIIIKSSPREQ
ncbi:hypothetical protein SBV1_130015 [Verrucomicrobia bacterium]|nr:hypothetical protein SBV1_130015 [Verrucomicrobiota bacterium]